MVGNVFAMARICVQLKVVCFIILIHVEQYSSNPVIKCGNKTIISHIGSDESLLVEKNYIALAKLCSRISSYGMQSVGN